jgi:hypothetical protein
LKKSRALFLFPIRVHKKIFRDRNFFLAVEIRADYAARAKGEGEGKGEVVNKLLIGLGARLGKTGDQHRISPKLWISASHVSLCSRLSVT